MSMIRKSMTTITKTTVKGLNLELLNTTLRMVTMSNYSIVGRPKIIIRTGTTNPMVVWKRMVMMTCGDCHLFGTLAGSLLVLMHI